MLECTTEIIHYKELVSAWSVRELKARWLVPWRVTGLPCYVLRLSISRCWRS